MAEYKNTDNRDMSRYRVADALLELLPLTVAEVKQTISMICAELGVRAHWDTVLSILEARGDVVVQRPDAYAHYSAHYSEHDTIVRDDFNADEAWAKLLSDVIPQSEDGNFFAWSEGDAFTQTVSADTEETPDEYGITLTPKQLRDLDAMLRIQFPGSFRGYAQNDDLTIGYTPSEERLTVVVKPDQIKAI